MICNLRFCSVLFSCVLLIFSCKSSREQTKADSAQQQRQEPTKEVNQDDPIEKLILGEWEWQKTICCGRTPHTKTADSLKAPKILKFQKEGSLLYLSGNELTATDTYTISYGLQNNEQPLLSIGKGHRFGIIRIKDDQLIIDYGYMDLQTEYYVRKK